VKGEIFSEEILDLYDYMKMKNNILIIFSLFSYFEKTNRKIIIPRITNNYQVRYEQLVYTKSSPVENLVLQKEILKTRNEDYRKNLFSKITIALRSLTTLELTVFYHTFYENKSVEEIIKIIHYGDKKVRQIRKSACIKFVSFMDLGEQCFKEDADLVLN